MMEHQTAISQGNRGRAATADELFAWVAKVTGTAITERRQISGGNRCHSWAITLEGGEGVYLRYQPPRPPSAEPYSVWREADWYHAIAGAPFPHPRLIAVHSEVQALLTGLCPGDADFRKITDPARQTAIIDEFIDALVALHRLPAPPGRSGRVPDMAEAVRDEVQIWREMYLECDRPDLLTGVAIDWLTANVPAVRAPAVMVHGDAGPGNFLFEGNRLTALIDWELAHAGDPMEDLAWFSMRATLEPVPDFAGALRRYESRSGTALAMSRLRYHRVLVAARVCIIRLRNVTGISGNSILSRALNRRLLVQALADAEGISLPPEPALQAPDTPLTPLYDELIAQMRDPIGTTGGPQAAAIARPAARVLKFLRENDRLGPVVQATEAAARAALAREQGCAPVDAAFAQLPLPVLLPWLAGHVARDAQFAALASGQMARRRFPPLEDLA